MLRQAKENADKLTGDNKYMAVVTYTSPNEAIYGKRMANAKSDDKITNNDDLIIFAKKQILDVPETALLSLTKEKNLFQSGMFGISFMNRWGLKQK